MTKNLTRIIIGIILIGLIGTLSFLGYIWFAGGSGEVSEDIADAAETIDDVGEGILFRIDPEESQATFTLEEDLIGVRTTVIGRTTQVGGDIVINFDNPSVSEIGTIRINARSFATDQEMRNRTIRNFILQSSQDEFEFIDFVPAEIIGLPESVEIGESYSFDISGDLTIVGESNPVTFNATVTINSETEISGTASSNIMYADWGISIPNASGVANVTEDVDLEITFVANVVTEEASTED